MDVEPDREAPHRPVSMGRFPQYLTLGPFCVLRGHCMGYLKIPRLLINLPSDVSDATVDEWPRGSLPKHYVWSVVHTKIS